MRAAEHTPIDVIAFGAHPDDVEMGLGGTLVRLVDAGYSVLSVALTKSQMSTFGSVESRQREFEEASRIMGCECLMLDFEDQNVCNDFESRQAIARIIRQRTPKLVFAPYHTNPLGEPGGLNNVDHYTTGQLVRDAIKLARLDKAVAHVQKHTVQKLYFYMVPRTVWANLVVDVSDVMDRTLAAIHAYQSQMKISVRGNSIDKYLITRRAAVGLEIGVEYAEAFVTDLPLRIEPGMFFEL